ncbi:MAG: hypothetical protein KDA60_07665 [Planctomycetales bacterium]|nr:hypothetical protein [Planctomycetales bacterium]
MTHPYGILSLLPPVAAIVLAVVTRRVVLSLFAGVFLGALVMDRGNVWLATVATFEDHLWTTLTDPGKLRVFAFTLLMGALVGVITRNGGMRGLVDGLSRWANSRRRGQLTVWLLGLMIFFDDYANSLLLGSTLRPLCDRLRISREKLAYLVDSTAAPVAGLAIVSTWIAVEIDYVREGLLNLETASELNPFQLFVASIPYRFYVLLSLVFVPLIAITGRDFGPMRQAEQSRAAGHAPITRLPDGGLTRDATEPDVDQPARWWNALVPIAVTVAVVLGIIVQTGSESVRSTGGELRWVNVFGAADSSIALQYGALAGIVLAMVMTLVQRLATYEDLLRSAAAGARLVVPAIAILWFASSLSRMTGNTSITGQPSEAYEHRDQRLYTAQYLQQQLLGTADVKDSARVESLRHWLPTIVFALAAVVSFCTGTSFGTMGILIPLTITLGFAVSASPDGTLSAAGSRLLLASLGSVLAGAIFGDHCSPISDTTILSSQASGCDHMDHVWTQFPYALTVALIAIALGTVPVGWGWSPWILLPGQIAALVGIVFAFGRQPRPN